MSDAKVCDMCMGSGFQCKRNSDFVWLPCDARSASVCARDERRPCPDCSAKAAANKRIAELDKERDALAHCATVLRCIVQWAPDAAEALAKLDEARNGNGMAIDVVTGREKQALARNAKLERVAEAAQVIKDLLARLSCVNPERVFELRKAAAILQILHMMNAAFDSDNYVAYNRLRARRNMVKAMTYRGGR